MPQPSLMQIRRALESTVARARKAARALRPSRIAQTTVVVGVVLRLTPYLYNRSLWLDEASLALNILNRSFAALTKPLDYDQAAPIGFLWVQKAAVLCLGSGERALRLFPLLCGIAALLLFAILARRRMSPWTAVLALVWFAVNDRLIYYSSEVKQYGCDAVAAVAVCLAADEWLRREKTWITTTLLAATGATALWFSHPVLFVLAAVGAALLLNQACRRRWKGLALGCGACALWAVSFGAAYWASVARLSRHEALIAYWSPYFWPCASAWSTQIAWLRHASERLIGKTMGFQPLWPAALALALGCASLWRRDRLTLWCLLGPAVLALAASALKKYPFEGRLLLFAVPGLLLVIAEGVHCLWRLPHRRLGVTAAVAAMLVLSFHPVRRALAFQIRPRTVEEVRPFLAHVRENWREGDTLYVYYGAQRAFTYYAPRIGFGEGDYLVGIAARGDWPAYFRDLKRLRGRRRVWLLFSHVHSWRGVPEERVLIEYLHARGTLLEGGRATGASLYLADLSAW